MYPNFHVLLIICATFPVTSCECEQPGSVLKCLYTYLRAFLGQTRSIALALMHISYGANFNFDNVNGMFAKKKERAMEFSNICDINSD